MGRRVAVMAGMLMLCGTPLEAQIKTGPAPNGEAAVVAQTIILANFDKPDCPLVIEAARVGDGSIVARCSNGEKFRVFSVGSVGPVALKCSAAAALGISGC